MNINEFTESMTCSECGGPAFSDLILAEKKDACYNKVRSRYKVWPSAYASGALVQCRKKGAANWGNKSKNEDVAEGAGNIGAQIKAAYQKIYNAGDDAVEFAYNDSPIFAQYWDKYEGDLDSIIAEVDPSELQVILAELTSAVEDQGLAEGWKEKVGAAAMAGAMATAAGANTPKVPLDQAIRDATAWYNINKAVKKQKEKSKEETPKKTDKEVKEQGVAEGEKIGNMDADDFDAAMARLKKLAGAGPMKTVWDPARRQYRNMPTAQQPAQQPKK